MRNSFFSLLFFYFPATSFLVRPSVRSTTRIYSQDPSKTEPFVIFPSPAFLSLSVVTGIVAASGLFSVLVPTPDSTNNFVGLGEVAVGVPICLASFVLAIQNGQLETELDDEKFRQEG
tara:strand:- start:298 stop:651 length:354 start_codon:yes stop_codon:yes gene_type:complete